jgi:hypothetical protein
MNVPAGEDVPPEQERELFPPVPNVVRVPPAVVFADSSPLRRSPGNLNIAQKMVLDGISTSIEVTVIAYRDLQGALLQFNRAADQHATNHPATVRAVMSAWTVIDAAHRLGLLVPRLRGLKHGPAVRSLLKAVEPVEPFRHLVQHLDGEIGRLLAERQPIWGSLSWAYVDSADASTIRIGLLMPGAARAPIDLPLVNPLGRKIEIPIGLVTLAAGGKTLSLSEVAYAVSRFGVRLERAAKAAFSAFPDALGAEARFDLPID